MAAALAGSPLFRERFQKAVAISGGLSLADPDAAAQKLAENFAPLAVEDGRFADTASAAEWLLTPGADVREWLCGLEPARIAALGKPAILYADDVVLSRDARSAVPLLLLSSATEFSGFVRDDLRPASSAARAYAVKYGSALCRWPKRWAAALRSGLASSTTAEPTVRRLSRASAPSTACRWRSSRPKAAILPVLICLQQVRRPFRPG